MDLSSPEPARTLAAASVALRRWTTRQVVAAAAFSVAFALLLGIPTVLIPNPVFGREIAVTAWSYPVWVVTSVLAGMLAATYVRPGGRRAAGAPEAPEEPAGPTSDAPSRMGIAGTALAWFAVGCPVCNKVALLALGYSGALRWFAPVQPFLAVLAIAVTLAALLVRLRGQVFCAVPRAPRAARA